MHRIGILVLMFMLTNLFLIGQGRFDDVVIKHHKLTDKVYMLEGAGGNVGIYINDNEVLMIDDQFAPLSDKLKAKIKELSGGKTTRLINTHWHGDHSGGNENFGKDGAMIIAHENVRGRMSREVVRGDNVTPPSPDIALPVVTYAEEMQLYIMDEPIMITHMHKAHTDGDSFVFLPESNVLHMGDCFFNKRFPFIDLNSGGSIDGMIKAAEMALMLVDDDTQIIPGHGPMATKSDLLEYHKFLNSARSKVAEHIRANGNSESLVAADVVKGYEDWAWGFIDAEKMAQVIFSSLYSED